MEALRAAQRLVTYALTKYGWLDGLTSAEDIDQRVAALAKSRSAGRINDVRRALQRMERYGGDTKKVVWPLTITFLAAFLADIRRVNYDKSGPDQRGQAAERVLSCVIMPFRFARVNRCACFAGSDKELCDLRSRTRARSASREERVQYAVGTLLGLRRRGPVRRRHPEYWALARPGSTRPVVNEWVVEVAQFFVVDTLLSLRKATANRLYGAMDEGATLVVPGYHLAALRSAGVKKRTTAAMAAGLHLFLLKGLLPGVALWGKPWVRRLQARGYPVQGFVSQPKNDLSTATSWTGKSLDSKNYTPTLRSLASVLTGMSLTECVRIYITAKGPRHVFVTMASVMRIGVATPGAGQHALGTWRPSLAPGPFALSCKATKLKINIYLLFFKYLFHSNTFFYFLFKNLFYFQILIYYFIQILIYYFIQILILFKYLFYSNTYFI